MYFYAFLHCKNVFHSFQHAFHQKPLMYFYAFLPLDAFLRFSPFFLMYLYAFLDVSLRFSPFFLMYLYAFLFLIN